MSQVPGPVYEFDRLPVEPIEAGTNLLVTGPSLGSTREVLFQLLACRDHEGMLLLTTDTRGPETVDSFETGGRAYDTGRMAVVDCTGDGIEDGTSNVHPVSAPDDLTGIGIAFSSLYEHLYGAGVERVRTGLYTLTTLLMYTEGIQPLYRFLHTMTGRIRTADGLGVTALDPETQDEQTVRSLSQPFDGEIRVREREGRRELRVRGLDDQPDGWRPIDL